MLFLVLRRGQCCGIHRFFIIPIGEKSSDSYNQDQDNLFFFLWEVAIICGLTFFTNSILYAIIIAFDFRWGSTSGRLITINRSNNIVWRGNCLFTNWKYESTQHQEPKIVWTVQMSSHMEWSWSVRSGYNTAKFLRYIWRCLDLIENIWQNASKADYNRKY